MSAAFALDRATGDLELTAGMARLCRGAEKVANSWPAYVTLFVGEWFLDPADGVDYQNQILEKGVRPSIVRSLLVRRTQKVPGIAEVLGMRPTLERSTRVLTVDAEVLLDSGEALPLSLSEPVGGA